VIVFSAHLSMLFTERAALDRPGAARAAGFTLVESWWPPADDLDAWADAVIGARVGVSCLNAEGGDIAAGERGFCNLPERDSDTFAAVDATLALADRVGCPNVNALPGLVVSDRSVGAQIEHAVEVYRELGQRAASRDRTIVVEPINAVDVPAYLLPTPREVAVFLEHVDHPNVRMLFDAYHCARAGGDPVRDVATYAALIGHVQYADCPGRGAPGTGAVPFEPFIDALVSTGYTGAIGMEYAPGGDTLASLGWR
jgi:hydroxypyruvate isomerase